MKVEINTCNQQIIKTIINSFDNSEPINMLGFFWLVTSYDGDISSESGCMYNLKTFDVEPL